MRLVSLTLPRFDYDDARHVPHPTPTLTHACVCALPDSGPALRSGVRAAAVADSPVRRPATPAADGVRPSRVGTNLAPNFTVCYRYRFLR